MARQSKKSQPVIEPATEAPAPAPAAVPPVVSAEPPAAELPAVEAPALSPDTLSTSAPAIELPKAEVIELPKVEAIELPRPEGIKPAVEEPLALEAPVVAPRAIPPRSRFPLLAASVAVAAAMGALTGGFGPSAMAWMANHPAETSAGGHIQALQGTIEQLRTEVAALKTTIDTANRNSTAQFGKIAERFLRRRPAHPARAGFPRRGNAEERQGLHLLAPPRARLPSVEASRVTDLHPGPPQVAGGFFSRRNLSRSRRRHRRRATSCPDGSCATSTAAWRRSRAGRASSRSRPATSSRASAASNRSASRPTAAGWSSPRRA